MPRTNRQNILLKHDQILAALEKAAGYISEIHDMFLPVHPQYAEGYENILTLIAYAHEFTEQMKGFV